MPHTELPARRIDLQFRAFSDRTRLRILYLLRGGECCVGDLASILRVPQPTASRHLAYLRRAGLVAVRRDGLWCHYRLAPVVNPFHERLLECLACCFAEVPQLRADATRAEKLRRTGAGCCPAVEPVPVPKATNSGCCCTK
jgi:ArsR family transcriptional regulator